MTKRIVLAALLLSSMAFAFGRWAVITVEDLPEYAIAGTPIEIAYTLRQHGQSPLSGEDGSVEATLGGDRVKAKAKASFFGGRYRATVTFPKAGEWNVRVPSGFGREMELLPVTVVARASAPPPPMSASQRGRHLFVAKGCVTCHTHQLTAAYIGRGPTGLGGDLSQPRLASGALSRFLADPSTKPAMRNGFAMPNLNLKPGEISALVAFLNREVVATQR